MKSEHKDKIKDMVKDRAIPRAKEYATGELPGQLVGAYLGKKYLPPIGSGKLSKFSGPVLGAMIGEDVGSSLNRAIRLTALSKKELNKNPSLKQYAISVGGGLVPFIGGFTATPEVMVKKELMKEAIYKQASSFDAKRKKQYWQMLKRLYGGADEAVDYIRKTKDTGIWHGTSAKYVDKIKKEGLKIGDRLNSAGKGVYFGTDKMTKDYAIAHAISPVGKGQAHRLRFLKPSELKGSKELYPNVSNMKKINLNGIKSIDDNKLGWIDYDSPSISRLNLSKNPEAAHDKLNNIIMSRIKGRDKYKSQYYGKVGKINLRHIGDASNSEMHSSLPIKPSLLKHDRVPQNLVNKAYEKEKILIDKLRENGVKI